MSFFADIATVGKQSLFPRNVVDSFSSNGKSHRKNYDPIQRPPSTRCRTSRATTLLPPIPPQPNPNSQNLHNKQRLTTKAPRHRPRQQPRLIRQKTAINQTLHALTTSIPLKSLIHALQPAARLQRVPAAAPAVQSSGSAYAPPQPLASRAVEVLGRAVTVAVTVAQLHARHDAAEVLRLDVQRALRR